MPKTEINISNSFPKTTLSCQICIPLAKARGNSAKARGNSCLLFNTTKGSKKNHCKKENKKLKQEITLNNPRLASAYERASANFRRGCYF